MLIRSSKSQTEYEAKRALAMKLLEIEASNEGYLDKKVSDYRNPYQVPEAPPERYRDATEIAQDELGNQLKLVSLFQNWGFTPNQANDIAKNIYSLHGNDGVLKILTASSNLKSRLDKFNKQLLSVEFVGNIVERFLSSYDRTLGGNTDDALEFISSSFNTAKRVFPTVEQIHSLANKLQALKIKLKESGDNTIDIDLTLEDLKKYLQIYPTLEDYESLKSPENKQTATAEMQALLTNGNVPTAQNIVKYTRMIDNILSSSLGNISKEDANATVNEIRRGVSISDEAEGIIIALREKLGLSPDVGDEVIKRTIAPLVNKLEEQTRRIDTTEERAKIAERNIERNKIKDGLFAKKYDEFNAYKMRGVYKDPTKVLKKGEGAREIIIKYYLEKFDDNKMTYEQIISDFKNAPLVDRNSRTTLPNPSMRNAEIDAFVDMEAKINPQAVADNTRGLIRLVEGQAVAYVNPQPRSALVEYKAEPKSEEEGAYEEKASKREPRPNLISIDDFNNYINKLPKERKKIVKNNLVEKLEKPKSSTSIKDIAISLTKLQANREYKAGDFTDEAIKIGNQKDYGGLGFKHRKIKIGKGLEADEDVEFVNFGKYILKKPHLYNDSKLTVRFPSGGAIPRFKPVNVSDDFREFMISLIENNKVDDKLYKFLSKEEKAYFQSLCKGAGLIHKLGLKAHQDDEDKKDLDRYRLLLGEIDAGNNNKDLIKELKGLIMKFMHNGRMKKSEGHSMLYELTLI